MPVLGNVHPIKIEKFDIFRDVISLLARVFIFLILRGSHEKYLKEIVGPVFEIYAIESMIISLIELLGSMSADEA